MKVLLINGSPRPRGCTYTALKETEKTLNEAGIETEIFHIGAKAIQGCTDCGACAGGKPCVFDKEDEVVAIARKKVNEADGTASGVERHYVDLRIACDERIADSYYFASALKCLKYFLRNPHLLELAPESVEEDVN
mgnify:CR=1 FL=1